MAYLDTAALDALPVFDLQAFRSMGPVGLDDIERAAVRLARADRLSSTRTTTRRHRFAQVLFGTRSTNRLADIRLETLRRFGVAIAHGRPGDWERAELRTLRFTEYQIDKAETIAFEFRRPRPRGNLLGVLIVALLTVALFAGFQALHRYFDDGRLAFITLATCSILFVAIFAPRTRR